MAVRWRPTEVDVTDVVKDALKVMEDAQVPQTLRAAALPEVIRLVAAKEGPGRIETALVPYSPAMAAQTDGGGTLLTKLAGRVGVPIEIVEGVYTSDGASVEISVNPRRLPRGRSTATKDLALLVTAMRQSTADEDFTSVDEVRRIAQEYDRYDPPNFASAIGELRGAFLVKGPARQRMLKLTRPGWQLAADLITRLGGPEA